MPRGVGALRLPRRSRPRARGAVLEPTEPGGKWWPLTTGAGWSLTGLIEFGHPAADGEPQLVRLPAAALIDLAFAVEMLARSGARSRVRAVPYSGGVDPMP
jgi:hypothetical protein